MKWQKYSLTKSSVNNNLQLVILGTFIAFTLSLASSKALVALSWIKLESNSSNSMNLYISTSSPFSAQVATNSICPTSWENKNTFPLLS